MKNAILLLMVWSAFGIGASVARPSGKYKVIVDKMKVLESQYSNFAHVFSIGTNDDGEDIVAMRISLTPQSVDKQKVGHLVVGTHHGNEGACPNFVLNLATELLKKYNRGDIFRTNLDDIEWTVVPVLNIPGYNANSRYEKGVDPNRDYTGICSGSKGGKLKSIRAMKDLLESRVFTGSITVHGYIGAMTYPWGVSVQDTHTADHNLFDQITKKAADIAGYEYGTSTDVIYPAEGAFEDFVYWKYGMWSLLLEMKSGSSTDIARTTEGVEAFFDQLSSSPSTKHDLTSDCVRGLKPDLHNE